MKGKVFVTDLLTLAHIGCTPEERAVTQGLVVNIVATTDISQAIASDNLGDTVDYCALQECAVRVVNTTVFSLIEKLVDAIADECLKIPHVETVIVRAEKPNKLPGSKSVGIEIEKHK